MASKLLVMRQMEQPHQEIVRAAFVFARNHRKCKKYENLHINLHTRARISASCMTCELSFAAARADAQPP
jgi:hypothetical protein